MKFRKWVVKYRADCYTSPPMQPESENTLQNNMKAMPDVSVQTRAHVELHLDRVGMRRVEIPVQIRIGSDLHFLPAKIDTFVSLDRAEARGIHMSRLYRGTRDFFAQQELSLSGLQQILQGFLVSHADLSSEATIKVQFDLPIKRQALKSEETGWRYYPVLFEARRSKTEQVSRFGFEVLYSSTCPCSAALARQLIQDQFLQDFSDQKDISKEQVWSWLGQETSMQGVAHAQRSRANVMLKIDESCDSPFALIDAVEAVLGTPVQAAVKRSDEQEFARLNATNLMFCEDAGRKVKLALDSNPLIKDYRVEVVHEESLHPHDAVAVAVKGLPGGFQP